MRILFITALPLETNNSSQIRNIGLLNGLKEQGCKISIVCPSTQHSTNKIYSDVFPEELIGMKIIRLSKKSVVTSYLSNTDIKQSIKGIIFKYLRKWYTKFSIFKAAGLLTSQIKKLNLDYKDFDIILSSSDPKASHKMAELIKKETGLKWAQYWGDPLLKDISDKSYIPDILKKRIESNLMKNSDYIFYVSPFTSEEQKTLFPKYRNKIYHLPPPFIRERIYNAPYNDVFTLGYFGSYYTKVRNILPLIDVIKANQKFKFMLAGNSDIENELISSGNITSYRRISREKVEELEEKCDALVCILNLRGTQIPGKIYQYAATNKPILLIVDGERKKEIAEYFDQFNRFIICENNVISINEAIYSLINNKKEYQPCREFYSNNIAMKMLNIINKV